MRNTLLDPHHVYELPDPRTARLGFLKHYGDKPYPFTVVLVGTSKRDDCLVPVTGFPVTRNRARTQFARAPRVLWSRGEPGISLTAEPLAKLLGLAAWRSPQFSW